MNKKKVDVLIPVYGKAPYLIETIKSITELDLINKIIFVLDRCDEFTRKLIMEKTLGNFEIIESSNPGITHALNLGLSISESEYIARIDSDDLMIHSRIKKQIEVLDSNNDIGIVATSFYKIDEKGKILSLRKIKLKPPEITESLIFKNFIAHPTVMYRKSIILNQGAYSVNFEGAEDYDLWLRMSKVTKIQIIEEPLNLYRISNFQYTKKIQINRYELDKAVRISFILDKLGINSYYRNYSGLKDINEFSQLNFKSMGIIKNASKMDYRILNSANLLSKISQSKFKYNPLNVIRALYAIVLCLPYLKKLKIVMKILILK